MVLMTLSGFGKATELQGRASAFPTGGFETTEEPRHIDTKAPSDTSAEWGAGTGPCSIAQEGGQRTRIVLFVLSDSLLGQGLLSLAASLSDMRDEAPLKPICRRRDEVGRDWQDATPSVVVADITHDDEPDRLIERIGTNVPGAPLVLVVPDHRCIDERVHALVKAGRVEAIVDSATSEALWIGILRVVLAGGRYVPSNVARMPRERFAERGAALGAPEIVSSELSAPDIPCMAGLLETLSPREREIIGLLADGLQNKTIAYRLGLSTHTVKVHLQNAYRKLNTHNRTQAAALMHRVRGSSPRAS